MIIAITGATGFIGKKLLHRIVARGDNIRLITRQPSVALAYPPEVEIHECDLITTAVDHLASSLKDVEVLYHCAGQLTNPQGMRALHVEATRKLVIAASGQIRHWVQLSSVGVYGLVSRGIVTEDATLNPVGVYEITKAESDHIVMGAAKSGAFSFSTLRPSNVFGSDMRNQSLFEMVAMIERGLFFYIGSPGASANYIHVDDVVEALVRCAILPQARGRIFNLSDHCTLEHFVETIAAALGQAPPRLRLPQPLAKGLSNTFGRLPGFPLTPSRVNALNNRAVYPITRIQHELDYAHVISMEDGIRQLVAAYQQHK